MANDSKKPKVSMDFDIKTNFYRVQIRSKLSKKIISSTDFKKKDEAEKHFDSLKEKYCRISIEYFDKEGCQWTIKEKITN